MSANKEHEFEDLAQLWHEDTGPSVARLKQQVRRAVILNRLTLVAEVAVAIAGGTFGVWLVVNGQWLVGVATILFSVFGLILSISTRWHSSRFDTETLQVAARSALAQANAQYRGLVGGVWMCAAALLFLAIIGWDATTRILDNLPELLSSVRAVFAATLAVAIALGFIAIRLRRVHKRAARMRELQRSMNAEAVFLTGTS